MTVTGLISCHSQTLNDAVSEGINFGTRFGKEIKSAFRLHVRSSPTSSSTSQPSMGMDHFAFSFSASWLSHASLC